MLQGPIFLCNLDPRDWCSSFIYALKNLATQIESQMKMNFPKIITELYSKRTRIPETLNQHRGYYVDFEAKDNNSEDTSTRFL